MTRKELGKVKRRVTILRNKLAKLGPIMRGSVTVLGTRNKQPYFSMNKEGKTKLIYLGKKRESLAREYSENHKQLKKIVDEMTELNMILLKKKYDQ